MRIDQYKVPLLFVASFVYLAANAFLVSHWIQHFELYGIGLQIVLLLPAIWFVLRSGSREAPAPWNIKPKFTWLAIGLFFTACLGFGYFIGQGVTFGDETSYKFQAEVFSTFHTRGLAPPGSAAIPSQTPVPIAYKHLILSSSGGWFSKYAVGWPLVLAIGERFNLGWAATPILGALLLIVSAAITREAFDESLVFPYVLIAVLSPYVLGCSTGRMSHALCAVLIAVATMFYLRGIRTNSFSQFVLMFVTLLASYHVRVFTAFIVTVVLVIGLFAHYFRDRAMLFRLLPLSVVAGVITIASVLLYNQFYTGHALLSPYALYNPNEIKRPGIHDLIQNVLLLRRTSIQSTLLYTFPFVFVLAGYGYWINRRSLVAKTLAGIFVAIFLAHFAWVFNASPIVGERYYYDGYFAVVILAAAGVQALLTKWQVPKRAIIQVAVALAFVQIGMTVVGANEIAKVGKPYREVLKLAEARRDCHCAVFLKSTYDNFYLNANFNLNTPAWKSANVFYFNDPGPEGRSYWANKYGWHDWVVISYDLDKQVAFSQEFHAAREEAADTSK